MNRDEKSRSTIRLEDVLNRGRAPRAWHESLFEWLEHFDWLGAMIGVFLLLVSAFMGLTLFALYRAITEPMSL